MAALNSSTPAGSRTAPAAVVTLLLIAAACAFWWIFLRRPASSGQPPPLTAEAREYVRNGNLALSGVEMKAAESYMKNTLVEITGRITNTGARQISLVELNCVFFDPYGQLVLRERVPIVRRAGGRGLPPGDTRSFRLPFDNIPGSWNQALPQLVIARIDFAH